MNIKFSHHALRRMSERGISEGDVLECLDNPVQNVYDRWRDVHIAVSERSYAVVYAMRGSTIEVLTVLGKREYGVLMKKYGFKRYKVLS